MTKVIAIVALGAASLGLLAQPAGAAKPPKWTPAQEERATRFYQFAGRDPACAIKYAKRAFPKFSDWNKGEGGNRAKFKRLRDTVNKHCAAAEKTPSSAPATPSVWTPDLEEFAWQQFSAAAGDSAAHADRRCVLDVIEAHWPDFVSLAAASESDRRAVGMELALRCALR